MRISDWSSDVCSSDLSSYLQSRSATKSDLKLACRTRSGCKNELKGTEGIKPPSFRPLAAGAPSPDSRSLFKAFSTISKGTKGDRSEEHTSELQSLMRISYAVFCLNNKKKTTIHT